MSNNTKTNKTRLITGCGMLAAVSTALQYLDIPSPVSFIALDLSDLPNHDNWGANSVTAEFDPEQELFRVRYAQKGTEDFGVLDTRGLGRFRFSPWKP